MHNLKLMGFADINTVTPMMLANYFLASWVMLQDKRALQFYVSLRELLAHIEDKLAAIGDEKLSLFYVKISPFFMSCDY